MSSAPDRRRCIGCGALFTPIHARQRACRPSCVPRRNGRTAFERAVGELVDGLDPDVPAPRVPDPGALPLLSGAAADVVREMIDNLVPENQR